MANSNPSQRVSIIFLDPSEIDSIWRKKGPSETGVIYIPTNYDFTGITLKGHPSKGDLYVIDPRDSRIYYPAKEISYILAKDQLLEIKDVFERLGATYIKITYLSEKSALKSRKHADNQNIGGSYGSHKMNASHEHTSARSLDKSKYVELSCEKRLTGKKANINWSELYWINENDVFRSEVNSLKDGLTENVHFTEETKSYFNHSSAQMNKIDAEYSFMDSIGVNVGFSWSNEIQESLTKTIVWDIEVSIAHNTDTTTNDYKPELTQNESDYLAEYKCVLADGEITSRERRSLERTRQRLGLSAERTAEDEDEADEDIVYDNNGCKHSRDNFHMVVEGVFQITGRGTIITGHIDSGVIHKDDTIYIENSNSAVEVVVTGVEMFRKLIDRGEFGDNVGLSLQGISKEEIQSGDIALSAQLRSKPIRQCAEPELEDDDYEEDDNVHQECEAEYIETLKEILEDGEISERERRLLAKLRMKLGISEERAAELESILAQTSLTEEEKEYLASYREMLAEGGEISDRERKLLNKIAKLNDISPVRVKELESKA